MSRQKLKGRKPYGSWYEIPRKVHRSADFRSLNPHALKLLVSLAYQFTGSNNGDLTATWSVMHKQHGFKSRGTLDASRKELLAANLIFLTRQGGRNMCSLFALTWLSIDECDGKLDSRPTTLPIRKEWNQKELTVPKTKRMAESVITELAEYRERISNEN